MRERYDLPGIHATLAHSPLGPGAMAIQASGEMNTAVDVPKYPTPRQLPVTCRGRQRLGGALAVASNGSMVAGCTWLHMHAGERMFPERDQATLFYHVNTSHPGKKVSPTAV